MPEPEIIPHSFVTIPVRIEQLTGLRFIAAMSVLLSHFHGLASTSGLIFFAMLGNHGVTLFFILSGFVLTHRYGNQSVNPGQVNGGGLQGFWWTPLGYCTVCQDRAGLLAFFACDIDRLFGQWF